jgi:uncharacterized membrane protein
MKKRFIVLMALILTLGLLNTVCAVSYTFTTLSDPGALLPDPNGINLKVDYPGSFFTEALDMNHAGMIVGSYYDLNGWHGFTLSDGTYTAVNYPGAVYTRANGINDAGMIAGFYENPNGGWHGFTLSGGTYAPLNYPGVVNSYANGINDAGAIVGFYQNATGGENGFLATPIPVPASVLLLGPGLAGLAAMRRRFKM